MEKCFTKSTIDQSEEFLREITPETTLHKAVKFPNADIVLIKMLIRRGANVNNRDAEGKTVLHLAAETGRRDIVAALLSSYAAFDGRMEIDAVDSQGETALHKVVRSPHVDIELVRMLCRCGAAIHIPGNKKKTVLHLAAEMGRSDIMNALLDSYAAFDGRMEIDAVDSQEETALHKAVQFPHVDIELVRMLCRCGAAIHIPGNKRKTVLHLTAEMGRSDIMNVLLDSPAAFDGRMDMNALDFQGETALHKAVKSPRADIELIKTLIRDGANVHRRDSQGKIASQIAAETDKTDIYNYLRTLVC